MTTAVVDSPVGEHRCAPEMDTVVLETVRPVGTTPPLHEGIRFKPRRDTLVARWIPDPRGEQTRICIWVPRTGAE